MNAEPASLDPLPGFSPEAFDADGYCRLRGLIGGDLLQRFEAQIAALAETQVARRGITPDPANGEPLVDLMRLGGGYRTLLYRSIGQLPVLGEISQRVLHRLRAAGALDALDFEIPLLTQGVRVDLPDETDFMLPMHQDYANLWSPRCVRIWLPLRPVGPGIGSMSIVPGSHRRGFVPHNMDNPSYPALDPATFADDEEVVLDLPAGDGILFSPYLFHASQHNRGNRIKFVIAVHIQDGGALIDPEDKSDPVVQMMEVHHQRSAARGG